MPIGRGMSILPLALLALSSGCATPTTQVATIAPEQVSAEQVRQRELAMRTQWDQQIRLDAVARPILQGAVPLCGSAVAPDFGFRFGDEHGLDDPWREPAARALGLDAEVRAIAVTHGGPAEAAGLRIGDVIRRVGDHAVTPGRGSVRQLGEHLGRYLPDTDPVAIEVQRDGRFVTLALRPIPVCAFTTRVVIHGALNAWADGRSIVLTTAMMRFAEDDELATIIAHELAHNSMGHMDALRRNVTTGGLLGLLGDVLLATQGISTGGYYTQQGMELGAAAYSEDFEREADYVGMYALALAGLPLDPAPTFWRHMAIADPTAIGVAHSHPTSAERFVRMEATIREIEAKRQQGLPLMPEMRR